MRHLTTFGTLKEGDLVKVTGARGTFSVKYARVDADDNVVDVTVIGGPAGRSAWRTFHLERIKRLPKKRQP